MAGYVVVQVTVHDPVTFSEYQKLVTDTVDKFGGRYLVRGGSFENLEGEWDPNRLVIIEFESVEQAKAWWSSDEYSPALQLREESASSKLLIIEGYEVE